MADTYRGQLYVEGNQHGLDAQLSFDSKTVRVITEDAAWDWPIADFAARRWEGNEFKLILGTEEFRFEPEEPLSFTFEIVDTLPKKTRATRRLRQTTSPKTPTPKSTRPPATRSRVAVDDIWTEIATGREEASLLRALGEVAEVHEHTYEPTGKPGDEVQVCTECRHVFVDLVAAEEQSTDPWSSLA